MKMMVAPGIYDVSYMIVTRKVTQDEDQNPENDQLEHLKTVLWLCGATSVKEFYGNYIFVCDQLQTISGQIKKGRIILQCA